MDTSTAALIAIIVSLIIAGFTLIFLCVKLYYWYSNLKERKSSANNITTSESNLNDTQINTNSRSERINFRNLALQVEDPLPPYERCGNLTNNNTNNESSPIQIQIQIHNPGSIYEIADRPPKYTL